MRSPHGHASTTCRDTGKVLEEFDTITCGHCNAWHAAVTPATPLSEMPGFCTMCMSHVCPKCDDGGGCTPFEKKLEAMESKGRLRRAILGG